MRRELIQQALDALQKCASILDKLPVWSAVRHEANTAHAAIAALRAALAEPAKPESTVEIVVTANVLGYGEHEITIFAHSEPPPKIEMKVHKTRPAAAPAESMEITDLPAEYPARTAPPAPAVPPNDTVEKALRRAFNLGQTYWQQADSEYTSDHKKSDVTRAKFESLVAETIVARPGETK